MVNSEPMMANSYMLPSGHRLDRRAAQDGPGEQEHRAEDGERSGDPGRLAGPHAAPRLPRHRRVVAVAAVGCRAGRRRRRASTGSVTAAPGAPAATSSASRASVDRASRASARAGTTQAR